MPWRHFAPNLATYNDNLAGDNGSVAGLPVRQGIYAYNAEVTTTTVWRAKTLSAVPTEFDLMLQPVLLCSRIDRDLHLTGKMDDPAWQAAEVAPLTHPVTGAPGRYRSTVRALYNTEYLYLGFDCEDRYIWGTLTEHDASVFTEECVEVFLCPSGQIRSYYELNLSPLNTKFDSYVLNNTVDDAERRIQGLNAFTCEGWITRVHIDGTLGVRDGACGWTAEYAIPFASIVGPEHMTPRPGDAWPANFCRIDEEEPGQPEFYCWSRLARIDFHLPWYWGQLQFGE